MTIPKLTPLGPDHQAALIVAAFSTWLAAGPGRRITLQQDANGFRVDLDEQKSSRGRTLQDAAAQAAQVATIELDEVRS